MRGTTQRKAFWVHKRLFRRQFPYPIEAANRQEFPKVKQLILTMIEAKFTSDGNLLFNDNIFC